MKKQAEAHVEGFRQETQYTCVTASITACLRAHGKKITEQEVNDVLGARPLQGASWEQALATLQYFGMRGTLVVPATISMLKAWTDKGIPVIIAWNPEGRPWSHASTVFHVDESSVHVMDTNIPDPNQTVRVVPFAEFYSKWSEKFSASILVRRPAMAVEREITEDGRQMIASTPLRGANHLAWTLEDVGGESKWFPPLGHTATEFPTEKALQEYLKEHPKADPKKHHVKDPAKGNKSTPEEGKGKARSIKAPNGGEHHVLSGAGNNQVLLGAPTMKHIGEHAQPGKGSVFTGSMTSEKLSKAISQIPESFFANGGGAYELKVPNAGADLVHKTSEILKKYPNAKKIKVPKQEGIIKNPDGSPKKDDKGNVIPNYIDVDAYVVDDDISEFSTDTLTVVARPANPQFLPPEIKEDSGLGEAIEAKKGFAVLTAFPGKSDIPVASKWGDEYAIIVPGGGKGADADVQKALTGGAKKEASLLASHWLHSISHTAKKKGPQTVTEKKKEDMSLTVDIGAPRNAPAKALAERGTGGSHGNREYDVTKGKTRKEKHKKDWREKEATWLSSPLSLRPDYGSDGETLTDKVGGLGGTELTRYLEIEDVIYEVSRVFEQPSRAVSSYDFAFNARKVTKGGSPTGAEKLFYFTKGSIQKELPRHKRMTVKSWKTLGNTLPSKRASYEGNPGGKPIYQDEINHGYDIPLAGGSDVVQQLQNDLLREQGNDFMTRRIALRYLNGGSK